MCSERGPLSGGRQMHILAALKAEMKAFTLLNDD